MKLQRKLFAPRAGDTAGADMGISATDEQENASSGTSEDENTDDVDCDAYAQEFVGLCIGEQAEDGTFFWAVFYR